jgi:hypothetical protein
MPLSRLENFLKNVDGNIIYVNPSDLDSTDGIDNQGNSQTRPFKTIQRALIEAARFSYNIGNQNDKFDRTTILLMPGTYAIDNRPGFNVVNGSGTAQFRNINGELQTVLQLTNTSNYDLEDPDNDLYKFNSTEGGVIVPRGTSIVGLDLRKTKIRPKYVPDPYNTSINPASIFKITGGCYFWQFSLFDGDLNSSVYYDNTRNYKTPNFSHHKLSCFEYADGVNGVGIGTSSGLTDLQMYYYKLATAYGASSGRDILDFPGNSDFEPSVAEFKIVGAVNANDIGISSAISNSPNPLTVTINTQVEHGLNTDDIVRVSGFTSSVYNGSWTVVGVTSEKQFKVNIGAIPSTAGVIINGSETLIIEPDNVNGASPYIFNCSLRSTYGMNGLYGDGSKSLGFKSIVVAQFTGVSLQRDDNAFVIYNKNSGTYQDNDTAINAGISSVPLHLNSRAIYKPEYENYHIKTSNSSFIQAVSIFSIGFSQHFLAESGGDISITNSNSNFGARSLVAKGFQDKSFDRDDVGYITHIIPPKDLVTDPDSKTWVSLNVGLTTNPTGITTTNRIYLYGSNTIDSPPPHIIDSFYIGAKTDDILYVNVATATSSVVLSAPILMPVPNGTEGVSGEKSFKIIRVGAANSITSGNTLNLETPHTLFTGESLRILSDDGLMPDGLLSDNIYYAITGGTLSTNQIQLSGNLNDAVSGIPIPVDIYNTKGGNLRVVSRVNDKIPNDIGHPIQYDTINSNWYITSSASSVKNTIRSGLINYNSFLITGESSKSYITRKIDTRSVKDRIYRFRYVIPKEFSVAREPSINFIIQESKSTGVTNQSEFSLVDNQVKARNTKIIAKVEYDSINKICRVTTEKPHNFIFGDVIKINGVRSSDNVTANQYAGYNGIQTISKIINSKQFEFSIDAPLGTFIDVTSNRNESLPNVSRQEYKNTFYIYSIDKLQEQEYNKTDGIYYLTCLTSNIKPSDPYFSNYKYSQSPSNLYPTIDKDNFNSNPTSTISNARNDLLGKVVVNDRQNSVTKETVETFIRNNGIGIAVTYASNSSGITTLITDVEHNLNSIRSLSLVSSGSNYGYAGIATVLYNGKLVGVGITGEGATVNVSVSAAGTVNGLTIVDGGSAYGVGMTMTVTGVTVQGGSTPAVVSVTSINNNIGDAIEVVGVGTTGNRTNSAYNGIFRISGITSSKSITYDNGSNPGIYTATTGINGFVKLTDEVGVATGVEYSSTATGIVTVTTSQSHGLISGNKFKIVGAAQTVYNGSYIVKNRIDTQSFNFYIGAGVTNPTFSGNCFVLTDGLNSRGGDTGLGNEKIGGRMIPFYAGIGTVSSAGITTTGTTITLSSSIAGFSTGDYLQIDNEVIRISGGINQSTNTANIIRGTLGTKAEPHDSSSVVRKIRVIPTELRRHSILHASSHTFEYVGFGHGNYSVALPSKQNRILSREEQVLTQSVQSDGGTVAYTGTNDSGDFYIGNKIISPINNTETSINLPSETFLGINDSTLSVTYDDVTINNSLKVTGGVGNFQSSEFRGPVSLYKKVTSTATDGIEAVQIQLKGNATQVRTYTVGISTPSTVVTQGDVTYNATSEPGKYLGWTYTGASTGWKRFGLISQQANSTVITPDQIGINTTAPRDLLEIRNGGAIFDQLRVTGIVTFDNGGSVGRITLGDVQNIGFTTFASGSGIYAQPGTGVSFAGITTFSNRVAITTNTSLDVSGISTFKGDTKMGNLTVDTVNILFPDGFSGTASNTKNVITAGVSTNASHYLTFVTSSTGVNQLNGGEKVYVDPGIYYNPSSNQLNVDGNVSSGSSIIATGAIASTNIVKGTQLVSTIATGTAPLSVASTTVVSNLNADFLDGYSTSSTNANNTVVVRDISGNFAAGIITAATGSFTNVSVGSSVTASTLYGNLNNTLTAGSYLTGTSYNNSAAVTFAVDATTAATVSKVVARDSSGDINFRYGYSEYVSMSHSSTSRTTDTIFYSSTDNFIRKNDATGFRASLNVPTRTGGDASGTWGINVTGNAATVTSGVYTNSSFYLGTTSITWNRASASQSLTGISIDGSSASCTGNAATATILQNTRSINGVSFNGSGDITITANTPNTLTRGSYLTGSNFNGSSATTWAVDADTASTGSKIVARDANGDINSRYANSNYINTTDDVSSGTLTYLMGKFGDNYYRSATAAKVASFISGQSMNISGSSTSCSGNAATASQIYVTATTASTYYLTGSGGTSSAYQYLYNDAQLYWTTDTLYTENITVNTTLTINSDSRLKTNIKPLEGSLAKILELRGVEYDRIDSGEHQIGLIAQEVEEVFPEFVKENVEGIKSVAYVNLVPVLIEAIKELKAEIDELKKNK